MTNWINENDLLDKEITEKEYNMQKNSYSKAVTEIMSGNVKTGLSILYTTLFPLNPSSPRALMDLCNEARDTIITKGK